MNPISSVVPSDPGTPAHLIVAGTAPDGAHPVIAVEPDGTARLSDATVERIAQRVAEFLRSEG